MEQLKLSHIAPYLPYGLKCQIDLGQNEIIATDSWGLKTGSDYPASYYDEGKRYGLMLSQIKPLLRPMSSLYKEIDGKVGIEEIAKIATGVPEWTVVEYEPKFGSGKIKLKSYLVAFNKEYNFRFFLRNNDFYLYDIDGLRECTHQNQLDLFNYLFQHHYDVWDLIGQNLAIDLNSISHE